MALQNWLIATIGETLLNFDDVAYPLTNHQQNAFQGCCRLLEETESSLQRLSRTQRNTRQRARDLLVDIYRGVGTEVFLLCALSITISKLGAVPQKNLLPQLRKWWNTTSRPKGLSETSTTLCKEAGIAEVIKSGKKRQATGQ